MDIRELVARRSDLSTFLVHLTRDPPTGTARDALRSIIEAGRIEARSMFGQAKRRLEQDGQHLPSQCCVCFTETPLEHTHLLLADIDNREVQFRPYGVAVTKRVGRQDGVNPVWYLDITPGHNWLARNVDNLLDHCLTNGQFNDADIEALAPFIEQMGTRRDNDGNIIYRKEFWWEREWRYAGRDFHLPNRFIGLCPENEIAEFERFAEDAGLATRFIDPSWGLEEIIARLAGFQAHQVEVL